MKYPIRINKYLRDKGLASRREADKFIEDGSVFINGEKAKNLGKLLPAKAKIIKSNTLQIILNEGKRHQIRVMLGEFNYTITSLKRIRIGNIKICNLKPGETRII